MASPQHTTAVPSPLQRDVGIMQDGRNRTSCYHVHLLLLGMDVHRVLLLGMDVHRVLLLGMDVHRVYGTLTINCHFYKTGGGLISEIFGVVT